MDTENERVLTFDQSAVSLYQLQVPYINMFPVDDTEEGSSYEFDVIGTGINPWTGQSIVCSVKYVVNLTNIESMGIWRT